MSYVNRKKTKQVMNQLIVSIWKMKNIFRHYLWVGHFVLNAPGLYTKKIVASVKVFGKWQCTYVYKIFKYCDNTV